MTLRAVDLSHWQAITDWDALCGYADILIFKATEGTGFLDSTFAARLAEARRRGKLIGVYHYVGTSVSPWTVWPAAAEMDWLGAHYAHRPGEVVIIDWEPHSPPTDRDGWVAAAVQRALAKGWPVPMVYMNTLAAASSSWAKTRAANVALWVARYFANNGQVPAQQPSPGPFGSYAMWQYTSNGSVPGVAQLCDVSLFYGDAAAWRAIGGAGTPTPTVQEDDDMLEQIRTPDQTIWTVTPTEMLPVKDLDTAHAIAKVWGLNPEWREVSFAEKDAVYLDCDTRRKARLKDQQDYLLGADPGSDPKTWLLAQVREIADEVKQIQVPAADAEAIADAIIAKLPAAPNAATGLTRDDVLGALRAFYAPAVAEPAAPAQP